MSRPFEITVDPNLPDTPEGKRQGTLDLAGQLHDYLTFLGGGQEFPDKDAFLRQLSAEMNERENAEQASASTNK
jgi:hypothetical protein